MHIENTTQTVEAIESANLFIRKERYTNAQRCAAARQIMRDMPELGYVKFGTRINAVISSDGETVQVMANSRGPDPILRRHGLVGRTSDPFFAGMFDHRPASRVMVG